MGEIRSDLPGGITPEEHGELYDALMAHPISAITLGQEGITRQQYIELKGNIGTVQITDPKYAEAILFLASGKVPGAERSGEETEPVVEHEITLRNLASETNRGEA